jgi:hypothetical protein
MSASFCLIAASLLAGQAPDGRLTPVPTGGESAQVITSNPGCNCGRTSQAPVTWQAQPQQRGLFPRLRQRVRSLFADDDQPTFVNQPTSYQGAVIQNRPAASPVAQNTSSPIGSAEEQGAFASDREPPLAVAGVSRPSLGAPIPVEQRGRSLAPMGPQTSGVPSESVMGHDELYQSIVGRLELQPNSNGMWVIRYGGRDDRYGGALALSTVEEMKEYHPGQLVAVQGEILGARPAVGLGLPIFRVQTISPVEIAR